MNEELKIEKMKVLSEKEFGVIFHKKESLKFNNLYLTFKYLCIWSPFLAFIWYIVPNLWLFPTILLITVASWLCSVKMKSLRDINYLASKFLKNEYLEEYFR